MKKIIVLLAFTTLVIGGQITQDKIASAMSTGEAKQEIVATQMKLAEEVSKEESGKTEKPVDSTTESTKKKNKK